MEAAKTSRSCESVRDSEAMREVRTMSVETRHMAVLGQQFTGTTAFLSWVNKRVNYSTKLVTLMSRAFHKLLLYHLSKYSTFYGSIFVAMG
jgi:ABC-type phosphate/phosphonate transport system ATPase subunit